MRYAFVLVSIIAVWTGLLLIAAATNANTTVLYFAATMLTLALFFIGFRRGKR